MSNDNFERLNRFKQFNFSEHHRLIFKYKKEHTNLQEFKKKESRADVVLIN